MKTIITSLVAVLCMQHAHALTHYADSANITVDTRVVNGAPVVSNASAGLNENSGFYDLMYQVTDANHSQVNITLSYSYNGSTWTQIAPQFLTGNFGTQSVGSGKVMQFHYANTGILNSTDLANTFHLKIDANDGSGGTHSQTITSNSPLRVPNVGKTNVRFCYGAIAPYKATYLPAANLRSIESGNTASATVPIAEATYLLNETEAAFRRAGVTSSRLTFDTGNPQGAGNAANKTLNVYFLPYIAASGWYGRAIIGRNPQIDSAPRFYGVTESDAVFFYGSDLTIADAVGALCHEIGHCVGLNHAQSLPASQGANSMMDYTRAPSVLSNFSTQAIPLRDGHYPEILGVNLLQNETYYLLRYVEGIAPGRIANGTYASGAVPLYPGNYDRYDYMPHVTSDTNISISSLLMVNSPLPLYGVKVYRKTDLDSYVLVDELGDFNAQELQNVTVNSSEGAEIIIVAASTNGGSQDIVISTSDGANLPSEGFDPADSQPLAVFQHNASSGQMTVVGSGNVATTGSPEVAYFLKANNYNYGPVDAGSELYIRDRVNFHYRPNTGSNPVTVGGQEVVGWEYYVNGVLAHSHYTAEWGVYEWRPESDGDYNIMLVMKNAQGQELGRANRIYTVKKFAQNGYLAGNYIGAFMPKAGPAGGGLTLAMKTDGTYSGNLTNKGKKYKIKGRLNADGMQAHWLASDIVCYLFYVLNDNGESYLVSRIGDAGYDTFNAQFTHYGQGTYTTEFKSFRNPWTKLQPCDKAGYYTCVFDTPSVVGNNFHQGYGIGTMAITQAGQAKLLMTMQDGRKLTVLSMVSKNANLPIHVPVLKGAGEYSGEIKIADNASTGTGTSYYRNGMGTNFPCTTNVFRFNPVAPAFVTDIALNPNCVVSAQAVPVYMDRTTPGYTNKNAMNGTSGFYNLKINAKTGLVTGDLLARNSDGIDVKTKVNAVVKQATNEIFGHFTYTDGRSGILRAWVP